MCRPQPHLNVALVQGTNDRCVRLITFILLIRRNEQKQQVASLTFADRILIAASTFLLTLLCETS